MAASGTKRRRRAAPAALSARLVARVSLDTRLDGTIVACFNGHSVGVGKFSPHTATRSQHLRTGLPLDAFASQDDPIEKDVDRLVRRLASHGLLEYCLGDAGDGPDVVIEPQLAAYWPRTPPLHPNDVLALSRFAFMRRRGNDMVLESPRAGALFKILNPKVAGVLAALSAPQSVRQLRRQECPSGAELLALLMDCHILFKVEGTQSGGLRADEGDDELVLWDFHDLLFHARSTEGRHANPAGGLYPYIGVIEPLPALRPCWPGSKIDLRQVIETAAKPASPLANLLRERRSTRSFDAQQPITLAELAAFLDGTASVQSRFASRLELGDDAPVIDYAARPYPSGGGGYELELYLAIDTCAGLARGFYHYDADGHALVAIDVEGSDLDAMLAAASFAMGASAMPQILIIITARFGRVSWKYSSIAYALILKDVGVLLQTFYLMATEMGLGGCAVGTGNIELFAKMTGMEFHVEGPVGHFALGRAVKPDSSC